MTLHPARIVGVVVIGALLAASCSSADDEAPAPPPPDTAPTTTAEPAPTVTQSPPADPAPTTEPEPTPTAPTEPEAHLTQRGVSAGDERAVEIAVEIFDQGGNAVDAAVAAAFAVSVVEPVSSGVGGGGSVILAGPDLDPVFYDYREVVNTAGEIPGSQAGVPGFVAGMGQLHEEHGELDWEQVIAPSIALAGDGVEVADYLAERISGGDGPSHLFGIEAFNTGDGLLESGDLLVQPELAQTLQRLADEGWHDFYTGDLADSLAGQVDGIDLESLDAYDVIRSEPARGPVGEYEVVSAAPALPGAALIQLLQIAEAEGIAEMDPRSAEYVDTLARAWGVAEETIRTQLGDPNFVDVPVAEITDPQRNAQIPTGRVLDRDPAPTGAPQQSTDPNTTHISVVDENGLAVSMTNTLTDFWGSGELVDGYFVNNALMRFTTIDSPANQPEPGRRSVTWSNPTMVLDSDGRPVLAIGSPGGIQLISALAIVISQWALQDGELQDAVDSVRFRGDNTVLYVEQGELTELDAELRALGWQPEPFPRANFGSVQALVIDHDAGTVTGADDPRRAGAHRIVDVTAD